MFAVGGDRSDADRSPADPGQASDLLEEALRCRMQVGVDGGAPYAAVRGTVKVSAPCGLWLTNDCASAAAARTGCSAVARSRSQWLLIGALAGCEVDGTPQSGRSCDGGPLGGGLLGVGGRRGGGCSRSRRTERTHDYGLPSLHRRGHRHRYLPHPGCVRPLLPGLACVGRGGPGTTLPTDFAVLPNSRFDGEYCSGRGDLGMSVPMTRPQCDRLGVAVLYSATTPGRYATEVSGAPAAPPGAAHLRAEQSSPSLRARSVESNPIDAVYKPACTLGPRCAPPSARRWRWMADGSTPRAIRRP
ncbi:hypothetical protein GORHZ_008_00015, partial [Gordonia rhizosphera NBRC 16068]